jgi:ATP-dependent RNA helicase MRH4
MLCSISKALFSRGFASSSAAFKKNPFKRLVVPINERAREMRQDKVRARTKERQDYYAQQRKYKKESADDDRTLPVLEEFTQDQLRQNENLVSKITNFDELKLEPQVREAVMQSIREQTVLRAQNYENPGERLVEIEVKPSPIQTISIHSLARHLMEPNLKIYTLAAETGSGKTWAYLAPLVDFLKQQETLSGWESKEDKALVRSVILVPTHELANQVYEAVKGLEDSLGLHCVKWDYELRHEGFIEKFKKRIDILITTPGKLDTIKKIKMISRPEHVLQATKFLVIDEADTLMDRSFVEMTYGAMKMMPNVNRMILCSATISNQYNNALQKIFPQSEPVLLVSPKMHRTPRNIKFKMIDSEIAPYQGSKQKALAQILYAIYKDGTEQNYEKRTVVFVNNKQDVVKVAKNLKSYGHDVVSLTGDDKPDARAEKIKDFVNPPKLLDASLLGKEQPKVEHETIPGSNIQLKKDNDDMGDDYRRMKVLVTSDVASRGLNFFGVRNVILYDSPNTSVDLLHRIGRTGRMGQSGRVFLITDKKTKHWVKAFMKKRGAGVSN